MGKYLLRRVLQMVPTLIGATLLIYWLNFALPGDPTAGRCGDRPCSPTYIAWFNHEYHLDQPFIVQYVLYLGRLLHGDLGTDFYSHQVLHELAIRYPTTIKLALIAVVFEAFFGLLAGVWAGVRQGQFADSAVTVATLLLISMPVFVLGSLAQLGIGIRLGWLPVTVSSRATVIELLMPGIVLGALSLAYAARLTRTSLVENLRADYVRTARAKGLSPARVVVVHTLRNSLLPVVTYIGGSLGAMMGGAIVTEKIFNINGIGAYIYRAINQKDGVGLVGAVACLVLIYLLVNLLVDLLYSLLDPRISHE
ncbi:MAG: ABC transporter permease [Propionibacteriaceae bacterium]|jgi:oligopeptide transport system permease protein|nr:ABC transporter permease [Propionibacteriaceae bacterium]